MLAGIWGRVARTTVSVLLVGVALVVGTVLVLVGALALEGTGASLSAQVVAIVTLAELGFVATAAVFVAAAGGRKYLRLAVPDRRDWRYAVGGLVATYAAVGIATLATRASEGAADLFSTGDLGSANELGSTGEFGSAVELAGGSLETTLLALVVVSVLVIGPSEELLFRGVVQRYLSGVFSRPSAVVVTSLLFAAVHAPTFALAASGLTSVVAAATIFAISVVLGYVYARTDNLVVPTVVHGVYDATLFGVTYLGLQTGLF